MKIKVQPELLTVAETISAAQSKDASTAPNIVALVASFPAEFLNPSSAYLKLAAK
jgi:anthranilate synthase component 1